MSVDCSSPASQQPTDTVCNHRQSIKTCLTFKISFSLVDERRARDSGTMGDTKKKQRGFLEQAMMQTAAGGSAGALRKLNDKVVEGLMALLAYLNRFHRGLHYESAGFDQNETAAAE